MPLSDLLSIVVLDLILAYPWYAVFLFYLLIKVVVAGLLRLLIEVQLFYDLLG